MEKILCSALFLFSLLFNAQKNTLLNVEFWKSKPNIERVKTEISKGNNPSEFNNSAFDPVTLCINNGGPLNVIKYLIEQKGNSVDKVTHDGRIYLHWAAMTGNKDVIEYLISKGSNVNKLDTKGFTPLTFTTYLGLKNADIYNLFFKSGVNPKEKYKEGANIMLLAIGNDTDGSLQKLFKSKGLSLRDTDERGYTTFDYATSGGNLDLLKNLKKKNIKANDIALINAAKGTRKVTNSIELFKYLIEDIKLKPTVVDSDGATALQIVATKPNQVEIINYLIEKGVDANKTDNQGNNALISAAKGKDLNNVIAILPKIKNINAVNVNGESALTNAVKSGSIEIISFLLDNKADLRVCDTKGNNLAYYLVQSYKSNPTKEQEDEFIEKLEILKVRGLDLTSPQKDGNTLIHLAVAKNSLDLLKKIEPLNIDINAVNKEKMTALHKAALIAKDDIILKYLISNGAKKDIKTELDETAYDIASENETLKNNKASIGFLR